MGRTMRLGVRNARRAACLIGLGMLSLISLVGAQVPDDENTVTVQAPSLEVKLSLLPGAKESELELRVLIKQPVKTPPEVEFHDAADGKLRAVKIAPAGPGVWVGTITQLETFGVGYVHVMATAVSGQLERHRISFATRGFSKDKPSVAYSVDGRFGLVVLPGDVPSDTRFLVSTLELPDPALPAGVELEAGPFQVMATQQIQDEITASIAIGLVRASPDDMSRSYQVRWLNPATAAWEIVPVDIGAHSPVAQADVSRLGTFVLTSELL